MSSDNFLCEAITPVISLFTRSRFPFSFMFAWFLYMPHGIVKKQVAWFLCLIIFIEKPLIIVIFMYFCIVGRLSS